MKPLDYEISDVLQLTAGKKLFVGDNEIVYTRRSFRGTKQTIIPIKELTGFRYGVEWIHGLKFVIGRSYVFWFKSANTTIRVSITSLYRMNFNDQWEKYQSVYKKVWNSIAGRMVEYNLDKINKGEAVILNEVEIKRTGISYVRSGKSVFLFLTEISLKIYQTYFVIHDKKDSSLSYISFSYKEDWNSLVLQETLLHLLN